MTNAATATSEIRSSGFFTEHLESADAEVYAAIRGELKRQQTKIELIASENITSLAVLEARVRCSPTSTPKAIRASAITAAANTPTWSKLAIERAKKLFGCQFANVQPNSGSQMNQAVFLALLEPGDSFMGLDLNSGGHLTHGSPVNMSGKWFKPIPYGVREDDHLIDMDEVARLAREHKPKLIIAGGTAYSRVWDFPRFREIADEVGAWLLVDMSHFSGLVAGGAHPRPSRTRTSSPPPRTSRCAAAFGRGPHQ
jgi:glycine hydroxymethyltransferase